MSATLADIQAKYGDGVYPLYKEEMYAPYGENTNYDNGYQGVVLHDELKDKIQCSICGGWFEELKPHITDTHKITVDEYRYNCGLTKTIPLINKSKSRKLSEAASRTGRKWGNNRKKPVYVNWDTNTTSRRMTIKDKVKKELTTLSSKSQAYHNRYGLCDAQISARLEIVSQIMNKSVEDLEYKDIERHDKKLLNVRFRNEVCGWGVGGNIKTLRYLKNVYNPCSGNFTKKEAGIIAKLRVYVKEQNKKPSFKELEEYKTCGLPHIDDITDTFGSWDRARMMAGLDQLLQEVK